MTTPTPRPQDVITPEVIPTVEEITDCTDMRRLTSWYYTLKSAATSADPETMRIGLEGLTLIVARITAVLEAKERNRKEARRGAAKQRR